MKIYSTVENKKKSLRVILSDFSNSRVELEEL